MKAVVLTRTGKSSKAFEIKDWDKPEMQAHEVLIEVEAFGLNFADVMARNGAYDDAPKIPCVLGYEVVGRLVEVGTEVAHLQAGMRVLAMTRFGGYAQFAVTDARVVVEVPEEAPAGELTALATQYGTAYFSAAEMTTLHSGDHVLIQAAAGGVGTALVQYAKHRGCTVYGTASPSKHDYLRQLGVDHPIDYRSQDFEEEIKKMRGDAGLDVVFDSIGGKSVKKGRRLLGAGGRIVCYGAAKLSNNPNFFQLIRVALGFGFLSPIPLLQQSKGIIGVNMLRMADNRPEVVQRCFSEVLQLYKDGVFKPTVDSYLPVSRIAEAHDRLGGRKTVGKVAVYWPKD